MPRLRIAMLTTFFPPYHFGGDAIGVQRLAAALADRGCDITVVHDEDAYLLLAGREPAPAAPDPRYRVIGLRSRMGTASLLLTHQLGRPVAHARRLREILAPGAFDVVWYHNVSLVGGPGLLAYGDGLKVYEAHEHWLVCPTHVLWRHNREVCDARACLSCTLSYRRPPQAWRYAGVLGRQLENVDAFIAKSAFSRDIHRQFGFPRPMTVIPYFLPDVPAAAAAPIDASPSERPYFLFVGRLEKIKGVQDVLGAFAGTEGPDLLVIGAGEYAATLHQLAAGLPRVRFLGRLAPDELARYYAHAIALVVPSLCYETFGIILIEAFRSGTPVIARRIGPFPEIVERGGGVLFADGEELAAGLARFHDDPTFRQRQASEASAAFRAHWREDVVVAAYLELLRATATARGDQRVLAALGEMQ